MNERYCIIVACLIHVVMWLTLILAFVGFAQ